MRFIEISIKQYAMWANNNNIWKVARKSVNFGTDWNIDQEMSVKSANKILQKETLKTFSEKLQNDSASYP